MAAQGWCPSTYRIHEAPDGGLARVKVPGGALTTRQLRIVADAARRFGSGLVEITNRANLQLRGIDRARAGDLRELLAPAGLSGPTAELEDRRNVLASPTAGVADDERLDVRPLVAATVAALDSLPADLPLPHKFGVLLDGGGTPTLHVPRLDLAFGAVIADDGRVALEVALGQPLTAPGAPDRLEVDVAELPAVVRAAAELCARPPDGGAPRRMVDVVAAIGVEATRDHVAAVLPARRLRRPSGAGPAGAAFGAHADASGTVRWIGLGRTQEGAFDADRLEALADAIAAVGCEEVRLTPWRGVVVPGPLPAGQADAVLAGADAAGWTVCPAGMQRRPQGALA
jgi:precorrin-3B synthase